MTEASEEAGRFDRRSLIKRGLVIGGAATALPIISTFNAPAFAASAGQYIVYYDFTPSAGDPVRFVPPTPTNLACRPVGTFKPDPGDAELDLEESTNAGIRIFDVVQPDCLITTAVLRSTNNGGVNSCSTPAITNGGTRVSIPVAGGGGSVTRGLWLIITCTA
jgi:hypothetical protein